MRLSQPPAGYFLLVQKVLKDQGLRPWGLFQVLRTWGTNFPDPISFDSAKRNGVGPPKKSAVQVLGCVPLNDRRTMSGHRKHPLPLPLLSTMFQYLHPNRPRLAHLAFAAGASRGPGGVLRLPAQRQRKAGAGCVSLPHAGKRRMHHWDALPKKMGVLRG